MIEVRTPSRLHFGLLAYDRDAAGGRQFGGAGVMVQHPRTVVRVRPLPPGTADLTAPRRLARRPGQVARPFPARAEAHGWGRVAPAALEVVRVPRPHTGLGGGTQLAMAIGRALAHTLGRDDFAPEELAAAVGRGRRSAIGVHGF